MKPSTTDPSILRPQQQRCCRCGAVDSMYFNIDDKTWKDVAGPEWVNDEFDSVLCLACFDQIAEQKGIKYSHKIQEIVFVGYECAFELAGREWYPKKC